MLNVIKKIFSPKRELYREAFDAYLNRLPEEIEVSWRRDGNFIVGQVKAEDGTSFMTQAYDADEFVEMVNDALFSVYGIPKEYFGSLMMAKKFLPKKEAFEKLNDSSVPAASMGFVKKELKFA